MKLCSACLLGVNCRYDGGNKLNPKVVAMLKKEELLPVCPEQLGGLPTPRRPAEQRGDKVVNDLEDDLTNHFRKGAEEVLALVKLYGIKEAILRQPSPSCGSGKIYDGSFSGKIIKGDGVTAALLKKNGIRVFTEEDLD